MTPDEIRQYLLRSYTAVDGLWFVKAEERFGFDAALDLDAEVWKVMPKIQARQIRAFTSVENGPDGLRQCYTQKLDIDGFVYEVRNAQEGFEIRVSVCPWYDKMVRSDRTHLAAKIGNRICPVEYGTWAEEFGCRFGFGEGKKLCEGGGECVLVFSGERWNTDSTDKTNHRG
ncbi:MAG: DUF6125 family protein [bacterium]|nr:DUF6125 family protein [bacterium]